MTHRILAAAAALFLGHAAMAQAEAATAKASRDATTSIVADPLLNAPASTLKEAQVAILQQRLADWPQLGRYRDENAALRPPGAKRVVFFGDSITDGWGRNPGTVFFPGRPYVNRGISGQTTAQMLLRFRQDVIDLHPAAVLVLAGTNDIAAHAGAPALATIEDNIRSMTELAQAHRIQVILASVLPVSAYPWSPGVRPAATVRALNAWMKGYAASSHAFYLDYYGALANAGGGMDKRLSDDGVHPTAAGYAIMAPLAQKAIDRALSAP